MLKPSHLELIRDLRDEGGDLFHEAVHAALTAGLEQSGDGQRGDAAVRICNQVLQIQVARSHSWWMLHGHLMETKHYYTFVNSFWTINRVLRFCAKLRYC